MDKSLEPLNYTEDMIRVELDLNITPVLRAEGLLAEMKRGLQNLRKTSGMQMGDKVMIKIHATDDALKDLFSSDNLAKLGEMVGAEKIEVVTAELSSGQKVKIDEFEIDVEIEKLV